MPKWLCEVFGKLPTIIDLRGRDEPFEYASGVRKPETLSAVGEIALKDIPLLAWCHQHQPL